MNNRQLNNREELIFYINFKLAALGQPYFTGQTTSQIDSFTNSEKFIGLTRHHIQDYQEKTRLLSDYLCPADRRIQNFIDRYLKGIDFTPSLLLPNKTFILDQEGLARELSLQPDKNEFKNEYLETYRIKQGILHNPLNDRRTTKGSFHIVEGGLPVPPDKISVPKVAFAHMLHAALNPPKNLLNLPYTSEQKQKASTFVSLYLRPVVMPNVANIINQKRMEVRYFVPGSLVSNLDFVESIFSNAGDPHLSTNDAELEFDGWTGHTGCIILAPQITLLKKKDIGLPRWDDATELQRKQGMCWKDADELYNNGLPFKLTCRDERGVVITLIGDNYFGYSKKEIKTQISYSANLYGLAEEEHAGGAVAFPRKNLGETFLGELFCKKLEKKYEFTDIKKTLGDIVDVQREGYGIDKNYQNIFYIPEFANINLYDGTIKWQYRGKEQKLSLKPDHYYIHPSGYKIHMEKHPGAPSWRLVSTYPEGVFCHKPYTVSGGGKSEISKSLLNAIIYDAFYISDKEKDFEWVDKIFNYDYSNRWKNHQERTKPSRPVLSPLRSLGSVVKLLTPSQYNTDEYNAFLESIPDQVKALVLFIKRFYRPERDGNSWREYFSVNQINGKPGHVLRYNGRKIIASYLRVGFTKEGEWNLHKLRSDFLPAAKLQMEDDITASVVFPADRFEGLNPLFENPGLKITTNCEKQFFQRPDEAIHRGYDKEAESDLSRTDIFTTNYEPLSPENAKELIDNAITFDQYTDPIKNLITEGAQAEKGSYFISPSHPRIVDGKPSKNPRYLQKRSDYEYPVDTYLAEIGIRLHRKIPFDKPVYFPVNAVLPGRRNNPPDYKAGIRPLSVYNPIHYQETPELFMDFICSLTGKSPSTTGAGSEGALTKGPFNMLVPTSDLNNTLLSHILTGYKGFSTAAGHIGPDYRFDHDISILIPELWSRLMVEMQHPDKLIEEGSLEKLEDFEYEGRKILASRLGYRITEGFLFRYAGRVFDEPRAIFNEEMIRPEKQDMFAFADGIENITEAQKKVALNYFKDGSVEAAIPPLKILLHIMAYGHYEGKDISDPELRNMFTREYVMQSDWYKDRLKMKQERDIELLKQQIKYAKEFMKESVNSQVSKDLKLRTKLKDAQARLKYLRSDDYLKELKGTIGADPLYKGGESQG